MPERRSTMHLDTVMTQVGAFTIYPGVCDGPTSYTLRPDGGAVREDDLFAAIADALGVARLRLFETGGDAYEAGARAVGRRQQRRCRRTRSTCSARRPKG
jgi:arginine deiminase